MLLVFLPLTDGLAILVNSLILGKAMVIIGSLLGGVGAGFINVQSVTLLQELSPKNLLGRVSGLFESVMVAGQLTPTLLLPLLIRDAPGLLIFFLSAAVLLFALTLLAFFENQKEEKNLQMAGLDA